MSTDTAHARSVEVAARPEPVGIHPAETAVLVVDMQNDFGGFGGGMDLAGFDIGVVRAAIGPTARVVASARKAGIPVIYLQHGYLPDQSDLGPADSKNWLGHMAVKVGETVTAPDGTVGRVRIKGTWNTEILPELTPEPGDIVLEKNRFSAFYSTELDATLRRLGVRNLIVTGCTTSVCVESTMRDAMFRDYRAILLADCTGELQGEEYYRASLVLVERMFGWVADSSAFVAAVGG